MINGPVFLLGDFNADLGNSVGSRGKYPVTTLFEFIYDFNMPPVNLTSLAKGSLLHFGRKTEDISLF